MGNGWKNGGRTYAVGKPETDAELAARLAAARERDTAAEVEFILATLTGKLPLSPFNDDWHCFSRYCAMQSDAARRHGFADRADVMEAASNRACRKARA